jgi:hypothetical protein
MLIVALVMAVIGLAALVTAVVTSNELIAWVCIAASVIGVVLLIIDALRERQRGEDGADGEDGAHGADGVDGADGEDGADGADAKEFDAEYPEEPADAPTGTFSTADAEKTEVVDPPATDR